MQTLNSELNSKQNSSIENLEIKAIAKRKNGGLSAEREVCAQKIQWKRDEWYNLQQERGAWFKPMTGRGQGQT